VQLLQAAAAADSCTVRNSENNQVDTDDNDDCTDELTLAMSVETSAVDDYTGDAMETSLDKLGMVLLNVES